MLKKITALFLIMSFSHAYALSPFEQSASIQQELNKTMDSLNYKLHVEWDQKDASFFDGAIADFEKEITTLQDQGMTNEELIKYTNDNIKDQDIRNEITALTKVINESQMTNDEARAYALAKLNSTYSQGTSWSGSRIGLHVGLIIGIIIICIIVHRNHRDNHERPRPVDGYIPGPNDCMSYLTAGCV